MEFQQEDFEYQSLYAENLYLSDLIDHLCPEEHHGLIKSDLAQFSEKAKGPILDLMWQAERQPPQHIPFDHWGRRIDEIKVSPAWNELHKISAREGIVSLGYERRSGEFSRLHQFLKLMVYHPSSAFYTCPLAMTDGASRVLETHGGELKDLYFQHLTSRDPEEFWTAGQWMTETAGGSDVSQTETVATSKNGKYYLSGKKWFTSAITANIALTLAKTDKENKRSLSLFFVKIRNDQGELNNIEVLRLKDKLGTKAMPTAELKLNGIEATLIGKPGEGVKNIATVLNISRLYNSVCATGTIYRLHSLVRDYSKKRQAFGKKLIEHPLHQLMLIKTQAKTLACVQLVADLSVLLGKSESGKANEDEQSLLRLLTPVAKLWTGKVSVQTTSELIEAFGGAGYIEDTQLPRFLRDAQVFSIWEGTTNVLSLDTLRAISKPGIFRNSLKNIFQRLQSLKDEEVKAKLLDHLTKCQNWMTENQSQPKSLEVGARAFSFAIGDMYCGLLMAEFAQKTMQIRDQEMTKVFIMQMKQVEFEENAEMIRKTQEALL